MTMQIRGGVVQGWDQFDPFHMYGVKPGGAANGPPVDPDSLTGLAGSAGPSLIEGGSDKPWHPDSPLFWFGVLLATTFGLIGASTAIRVGPFRASAAAGKT